MFSRLRTSLQRGTPTMTQQSFSEPLPEPLSNQDREMLAILHMALKFKKADTFSSDTLRMLGFDKYMMKDSQGRVNYGVWFRKLSYQGLAEKCGWTRSTLNSNHGRQIQEWKLKQP
jgi:hypothetical protein